MRATLTLLAILALSGCGSELELELSPPDFFEDGSPTADPAELRNPSAAIPAGQARFVHAHLHATHARLRADFRVPSTCELIDTLRTTVATVEQKVPFETGSFRTEWVVSFGQETPGQWKAGWYRVACKVGKQWTSASFEVVAEPPLGAEPEGDQSGVTLREAFQRVRFYLPALGETSLRTAAQYTTEFDAATSQVIMFHAFFVPPIGRRIKYHAPECGFARRGSQALWRTGFVIGPDSTTPGSLIAEGGIGQRDSAGALLPGHWYFACADDGDRILRDSVVITGSLPPAGKSIISPAIASLEMNGGHIWPHGSAGTTLAPADRRSYAYGFSAAETRWIWLEVELAMQAAPASREVPFLCALYFADGAPAGEFATAATVNAGETAISFEGGFPGPLPDGGWATGRYLGECTSGHDLVGWLVFEIVP